LKQKKRYFGREAAMDRAVEKQQHRLRFESCAKRVRVLTNGKTIADSLCTLLLAETGQMPVYYFPQQDLRADFLKPADHHSQCPYKGKASYWTLEVGGRRLENAVWSYRDPLPEAAPIKGMVAFDHSKIDHWFEEDEEVFGHPRDPRHRIDVRPSSRKVRAVLAGETIALSRRALFLFETDLPIRYYVPAQDVRLELLAPTHRQSTCPYKGNASYWSIKIGDRVVEDAVWSYLDPLPECPRIKGHFCFYPEKLDRLEIEGEAPHGE
jgi:uncharacterized protein (DUF427 family)